jgi:hypothetical protein
MRKAMRQQVVGICEHEFESIALDQGLAQVCHQRAVRAGCVAQPAQRGRGIGGPQRAAVVKPQSGPQPKPPATSRVEAFPVVRERGHDGVALAVERGQAFAKLRHDVGLGAARYMDGVELVQRTVERDAQPATR